MGIIGLVPRGYEFGKIELCRRLFEKIVLLRAGLWDMGYGIYGIWDIWDMGICRFRGEGEDINGVFV